MSDERESEREVRLSRPVCEWGAEKVYHSLVGQSRCHFMTNEAYHVILSIQCDNGGT